MPTTVTIVTAAAGLVALLLIIAGIVLLVHRAAAGPPQSYLDAAISVQSGESHVSTRVKVARNDHAAMRERVRNFIAANGGRIDHADTHTLQATVPDPVAQHVNLLDAQGLNLSPNYSEWPHGADLIAGAAPQETRQLKVTFTEIKHRHRQLRRGLIAVITGWFLLVVSVSALTIKSESPA